MEIVRAGKGLYLFPHMDGTWAHVKAVAKEASDYPEKLPAPPDQDRDLTW